MSNASFTNGRRSKRGRRHLAGKLLVDVPLDAAYPLIIGVRDAKDLRRVIARWIGALDRRHDGQARNAERVYGPGLVRRQAALHPFEPAGLVMKSPRQGGLIEIGKKSHQLLGGFVGVGNFLRVCSKPIDPDIGCQDCAIAVHDVRPAFRQRRRCAR